jgi:REP element-mobilizing transposase RayT
MPQSLAALYVHVIFGTKDRMPFLADRVLRDEMHRYFGGIINRLDCSVLDVGGTADHIHVLVRISRTATVADLVKETKRASTIWFKRRSPDFSWQAGYGAFSVGYRDVEVVREYIKTQEVHHQKWSFEDEYRAIMLEHGVEIDERYLWD